MINKLNEVLRIIKELKPALKNATITYEVCEYPTDQKYDVNKSNPPYAHLVVKKPKTKKDQSFSYEIMLFSNMFEYFGDEIYKGSNEDVLTYFTAIDVEFSDETLLIYNFIHELGHVLLYEEFKKDLGGYENLLKYDEVNNHFLNIIFKNHNNHRAEQKYHFQELYSEKFATFMFPVVIKMIEERTWNLTFMKRRSVKNETKRQGLGCLLCNFGRHKSRWVFLRWSHVKRIS